MKVQFSIPNANVDSAYLKIDNTVLPVAAIGMAARSFSVMGGTTHTRFNIDIEAKIQEAGHSSSTSVALTVIEDTDLPVYENWKAVTVQSFQGGEITFIPYDSVPVVTVIPPDGAIGCSTDLPSDATGSNYQFTHWPYRADRTHSPIGVTSFSGYSCQVNPANVAANEAARKLRKAQGEIAFRQSLGI